MATLQEVSENWDDDFEFQVEKRKMSTATAKTEATENWDDDFEDSRQSPKKVVVQQRHREESWDDEEDDDESAEFGFFAEEDRTVTAKSRRAALARLTTPLPPLNPAPHPRSPTSSVFSVPTTIHTYSSTTHLRPTSVFALIPPSPPIHKERERRRLRKKSRPKPQGVFELAELPPTQERRSFSDLDDLPRPSLELSTGRTAMSSRSDLSSAEDRPPLVATAADTSIGSSSGPVSIPPTPSKGTALLSRIGSVKKWSVRRKRGDSTAPPADAPTNDPPIEREPIISSKWDPRRRKRGDSTTPADTIPIGPRTEQAQSNSIVYHLPTPGKSRRRGGSTTPVDVISNERRNEFDHRLVPRASSSLSSYQHHHHALPPALPPLPLPFPHPHAESSQSAPQLPQQQPQQRTASSSWFFRSTSTGNPEFLPPLTPTTTPTKLVKRKSFGFVHLGRGFGGHGGGENEVVGGDDDDDKDNNKPARATGKVQNHERYTGLGLGRAGASVGVDDDEGGETPKRNRQRSFSRLLMDRDKEKEKEKENEDSQCQLSPLKEKEGARSFMGNVRRISLVSVGVVGRHKRAKSGIDIGGSGGSPARIPPVPPILTCTSQVSLRIPSTGSSQRHTSSNAPQRAGSLSCPNASDPSGGDPSTPIRSASGSSSRPSSISSSTKRRRRRPSKTRPKSSKSEEGNGVATPSLDLQEPSYLSEGDGDPKTPTSATATIPLLPPIELKLPLPPLPPAAIIPLLPPIELQPPSPPRTTPTTPKSHIQRRSRAYTTNEFVEGLDLDTLGGGVMSSSSTAAVFFTPTSSLGRGVDKIGSGSGGILPLLPPLSSPGKLSPGKSPQQSVSLGRSTAVNAAVVTGDESAGLSLVGVSGGGGLPRRNSLGDLKIPARISQAQVGLRRDLGMVREFASNVEQLKELQNTYNILVVEVQALLDTHLQRVQPIEQSPLPAAAAAVPKPTSPNFFTQLKARPKARARSNTNPTPESTPDAVVDVDAAVTSAYKNLVEAFWNISSKYKISWECAELLIELGSGGDGSGVMSAPASAVATATTSVSAPAVQQLAVGEGKMFKRERAITLADDETKHSTMPMLPPLVTHNEAQTQVPSSSQPSSAITGSSSMPSVRSANASDNGTSPPLASPPSISWRASTGRHDLSQRQLVLLREMLNNDNGTSLTAASGDDVEGGLRPPPIPVAEDGAGSAWSPYPSSSSSSRFQHLNRDWKWGDAMNSTITLSEEQEGEGDRRKEKEKKRRSGRLGMSGIRDMLRSLKKTHGDSNLDVVQAEHHHHHHHHHGRLPADTPMMHSTTSLSTESSMGSKGLHQQAQAQAQQQQQQQQSRLPIPRIPSQMRRRGRSSTGPESMRSTKGPSSTSSGPPSSFTTPKPSTRRPSLASIFRIGSGNNNTKARPVSSVGVSVEEPGVSPSSAFGASEHDLSTGQCSSATTDTTREDTNSTGGEEEEDWDRMDSASDLDAAAAKALGMADGAYDISATVRGRNGLKNKVDEKRKRKSGVSPYLQHQSSYESDQHNQPPPVPSLPASSSSTGLGGFLARHSIIPKRSFTASQSSIWGTGAADGQPQHSPTVPSRLSRHSNFEEKPQPMNAANVEPASLRISSSKSAPTTTGQSRLANAATVNFSPSRIPRPTSRPSSSRSTKFPNVKTGSFRSMPPHLVAPSVLPNGFPGQLSPLPPSPDPKLAMIMTPENIKPLLENAKEVHVKLHECIEEIRALIEDGSAVVGHKVITTTQAAPSS